MINGRELAPTIELFKTSGLFSEDTVFPNAPSFKRTAIGCCVMFFQQFIGCNGE